MTKEKTKKPKEENHIIIKKSDDKKAQWFVVHTYSGHEQRVAQQLKQRVESMNLEDKILEILIPTQERIEILYFGSEYIFDWSLIILTLSLFLYYSRVPSSVSKKV